MTDSERVEADRALAQRLRDESCGFGIGHALLMQEAGDRLDKLNDEVERWISAYRIAWDQAMANGEAARELATQTSHQPTYATDTAPPA